MSSDLPYRLTVSQSQSITKNMRRVTLTGDDLNEFPEGCEGGYVKLLFPPHGETKLPSAEAVDAGAPVIMRTYTVRKFNKADLTLDIDLVLHGEVSEDYSLTSSSSTTSKSGPASSWAAHTQPGDHMLMYGPGKVKFAQADADWLLFAGDMTALPAISCQLEQLPDNARGYAVIEINADEDQQDLKRPEGIEVIWVVNSRPDSDNTVLSDAVKALPWLSGQVAIWAACEFSNMRLLRSYFKKEKQVGRDQLYVSSYWKMGQTEDKHKVTKKQDAMTEN
ncbi:siderophore-interacting protein [Bacterioplanoides sp.]|uniref:siderophore-interacting protein n=1 Tax=Bacterioplanoides sp. TaxID=2066072 RepID=UPI003B593160